MRILFYTILIFCLTFLNVSEVLAANTHTIDLELSSSQYLSITDGNQTGLDITGDISFEAWVKLEQLPSTAASLMIIVGKDDRSSGDSYRGYMFWIGAEDKLYIYYNDGTNTTYGMTDAVVVSGGDVGSWVHLAGTADVSSQTIVLYKNGSSVSSSVPTGNASSIQNNAEALHIGAGNNSGAERYFDGMIDDIRIWNDIRSSVEISANYNCSLAGNEAGLVAYWKLDNSLLDETTNNNDLTNNNSAVFQSGSLPFTDTCAVARRIIITQ